MNIGLQMEAPAIIRSADGFISRSMRSRTWRRMQHPHPRCLRWHPDVYKRQAEGYDEQYPLREYKDWLAVNPFTGQLNWIWEDMYIGAAGLLNTGDYTPDPKYGHTSPIGEYMYRHAAENDDFRYLMCPGTGEELLVIAKLAGVEPVGYDDWAINSQEVAALELSLIHIYTSEILTDLIVI